MFGRRIWCVLFFLPVDVNCILQIPISLKGDPNELCWVHAKDGTLTVKDVYRQALGAPGDASCSNGPDPVWKKLWKINVPPKVREFGWRACWDIIPHGANLYLKGITEFIFCPRCGSVESLLHLIRDCPWVHNVWLEAVFSFPDFHISSFRDLLDWIWGSFGSKVVKKFVIICWQIWKSRNDAVFNNIFTPSLCVGKALEWLKEYHNALTHDYTLSHVFR